MSYPEQYPGQQPDNGGQPWQQPPSTPGSGPQQPGTPYQQPGSPPPDFGQSSPDYQQPPPPPGYQQPPSPPAYQQPPPAEGYQQQPPPGYQGGYPPQQPPPPPGYGYYPPGGPPSKKSAAGPIAIILIVVLIIGAGAFGAWWYFGQDDDSNESATVTGTEDDDNGDDEVERIEDTESGVSYIEMDGWEFTGSNELIEEFSSEYMANASESNVDVGAIYGAWGERGGEDLSAIVDDMAFSNAGFFFPEFEDAEEVSSDETNVGDVPAHDSRIIVEAEGEPPMYVRALAVDIDGRIAGLIGLADNDNQEIVEEMDTIMDSMEIIDHD